VVSGNLATGNNLSFAAGRNLFIQTQLALKRSLFKRYSAENRALD
jgi:hypothetical protein